MLTVGQWWRRRRFDVWFSEDLTITPVNDAPVATDVTVSTAEDTPIAIQLIAADAESARASLQLFIQTQPQHGVLTQSANGSYSYLANQDFNGTDSFTYKVSDGELDSNLAAVSITVTAVLLAAPTQIAEVVTNPLPQTHRLPLPSRILPAVKHAEALGLVGLFLYLQRGSS